MKRRVSLLVLMAMVPLLGACGGLREDLGLGRSPPDEFAVIDRPPLSMPPDFSLRPPRPGSASLHEVDPSKLANDALFSSPNPSSSTVATPAPSSNPSTAETSLLATVGAEKSEPNIRDLVDRETTQKVVTNEHLVGALLSWTRSNSDEKPAATVDASQEAARIKDALDKGQPVNQGATPVIEQEKSGWLGL